MPAENYDVEPGDTIPKIAAERGFRRWETIWDDGANAELRKKRENPNVLHPGDIVVVPEKKPKTESCNTEAHHVFEAPVMKEMLRIKVEDIDGTPMANKPYVLTVDGKAYPGDTNGDGMLEQLIPVRANGGELEIEGSVWPLEIGHLNPVDEETADESVSGAQARLNNLGYDCPENGELDDETKAAIKAFQAKQEGLQETGELDDDTRTALRDRHGC